MQTVYIVHEEAEDGRPYDGFDSHTTLGVVATEAEADEVIRRWRESHCPPHGAAPHQFQPGEEGESWCYCSLGAFYEEFPFGVPTRNP